MKKILLCGPRSKNFITGVSLAFDLLIKGLSDRKLEYEVVDTLKFGKTKKSGSFNFKKSFSTIYSIVEVWIKVSSCQTYYSTMATSFFGFIRDLLMVTFAKINNKKIILHLHGGGFEEFYEKSPKLVKLLIQFNIKNTDRIIVLGELLKKQFYCVGDIIQEKLVVVPNGLTLGVSEPTRCVKSIKNIRSKEILYLSNMMPTKGYKDLIKAIELLKNKGFDDIHLNLCGGFYDAKTEEDNEIKSEKELLIYLKNLGLENFITYHGEVLGDYKKEQLERAHLFILPTYYPWEGQPLSIIEAMAFATPVISTYHKGIPELIENAKTGYFVEAGSPEQIASYIKKVFSDIDDYENMSHQSRNMYEKKFKQDVHLEKLINTIYEN